MSGMVTLTLTGAKRFMISGTTHTIEKWTQIRVDRSTAEHLLDQYWVDKSNQEQPYFEEGVVTEPPQRADRKRIRASHRRLEREAAKAAEVAETDAMQDFRQDAKPPQDPYNKRGKDAPDWAVNTDVIVEAAVDKVDNRVFEEVAPAREPVQFEAPEAPKPAKRASKKGTRKRAPKA